MAKNSEQRRAFRAGLRSRLDVLSLLKGDSFWIRAAIFVVMSGIFLLLVAVTKRGTRTTQQEQTVIEEQDTVKPHTIQQPPPAKVGSSAVIKPNVK